ncbi:MAG: NADH-quinone oxidoreductase subunit G [Flavobacteriales bacterium]|jgi:NADH-quinone oxidoreductase subunit G
MAIIEIDGSKYDVEDGKNILDACLGLGLDLPYFCWHPSMGSVGSCRQCAVRVYADENDTRGRILMSCMTPVAEGMRLSIEEEGVSDFRDKCIEVTMANHPHDCPVCEEGGECHLQDVTHMSNHTERRYKGQKKTYENQDLGPCINHEMNRCITCYRCVRFYNDYAGGKDLAALGSRENIYFGRHEDGVLESVFSGNLVEVCPTGVFTDKTLARSYNRKWDLQTAPSICQGCSLGCNIAPAERQGKIKRITNRYHGEVNGYFICDKGRFSYDHINADSRLQECLRLHEGKSESVNYDTAIDTAAEAIITAGLDTCIGIGSEKSSVEENLLLKKLVGPKNFCSGMSEKRQTLLSEILNIYQRDSIHIASLKSMEACDAVIILGEDLINSAPRMALSVRQSTRNLSFEMAKAIRIPLWQDASVRILAQDARSPLIIASVAGTELDEIASDMLFASPDDIANFGFAVAHEIDSSCPKADVSSDIAALAKTVAQKLVSAKNPLVISGTSLNSLNIIHAAAQIAAAISNKRSNGSISQCATSFVLPEANSMGLAMLLDDDTLSVEQTLEKRDVASAIVLQNDLYHHAEPSLVDDFLTKLTTTVALSQIHNRVTAKADSVFPASSFVETEGTLVNNEARAQRYFSVFSNDNPSLKDNWFTITSLARALITKQGEAHLSAAVNQLANIQTFDDVVDLTAASHPLLRPWDKVAPSAKFRIAGMKMPRQPHRYSGRTSLQANVKVSENKQPQDDDSALNFSMEGAPINRPPAVNAIIWSPGWNSNEAVNKFQDEIGGQLTGGDPGVRLLDTKSSPCNVYLPQKNHAAIDSTADSTTSTTTHNTAKSNNGELLAVAQSRLFDSCELSIMSSALALRAEKRVAMMHSSTAAHLNLNEGDPVTISIGDATVTLPLAIQAKMSAGIITLPDDVQTRIVIPATLLPAQCNVSGSANG